MRDVTHLVIEPRMLIQRVLYEAGGIVKIPAGVEGVQEGQLRTFKVDNVTR